MAPVFTLLASFKTCCIALLRADYVYWLKWILSYVYIKFRERGRIKRMDFYDFDSESDPVKLCFIEPREEENLEKPFSEARLLHSADEIFFYGVNSKAECLIVRIARDVNHRADAWIHLKLATGKTYQLAETSGYQQSSCDDKTFSCGGLQMHYLSPMRRWRIFFRGYLKETCNDDPNKERMVYVKFAFLWRSSADIFDCTSEIHPKILADAFAQAQWKNFTVTPSLEKLYDCLNLYTEPGTICGNISVGEDREEYEMYLFGEKTRFLGDVSAMQKTEFSVILGYVIKNGSFVHLWKVSIPGIVKNLQFGYIVQPDGRIDTLQKVDITLQNNATDQLSYSDVKALFATDQQYELTGKSIASHTSFGNSSVTNGFASLDHLSFHLNGKAGKGIVIQGKNLEKVRRSSPIVVSYKHTKAQPLTVTLNDGLCQFPEITGGKGSSLGKLTDFSKTDQTFIVPKAVVVTTFAYKEFISNDLLEEIKCLEDILYGCKNGDVQTACERLSSKISQATLPGRVRKVILESLLQCFGEKVNEMKFAVRSSATGEDSEQTSAAGQMDTFLGVTGLNEILSAVKKCWASQFKYIAVQYKRNCGQVLNSPMAVVIQEMINCDTAGVLFTCDPVTGDACKICVTANYGLGETVVSGSEEPDTIELQRNENDALRVKNVTIGAKQCRIVLKDDGGTNLEDISEENKGKCCLSEETALRLGNVAVKIEKFYRSQRDIEWGLWNNNLYIFQSRPVTNGTEMTDFEIKHEFDGPLRVENDFFSLANVGEVMPGATSPLGLEILLKVFNIGFRKDAFSGYVNHNYNKYQSLGSVPCCNHMMVSLAYFFNNAVTKSKGYLNTALMISMFGRILDDEELFEVASERHSQNKKLQKPLKTFIEMLQKILIGSRVLRKAKERYENYSVHCERFKTAEALFNQLLRSCNDLTFSLASHMTCTNASSLLNMFVFSILGKAKGEFDSDVYQDLSLVLTTNKEVESADVPSAIQDLAFHIQSDIQPDEFKKMTAEDALHWLQRTPTKSGKKFREFLKRHGHRCLKEFDMHSQTWEENPIPLVNILQNMSGTISEESAKKSCDSFNQIMSKLRTPLGFVYRLLLKILLPKCRKAVQLREESKSLLVKTFEGWRKGYRHLAKLMVLEGRLPSEDLLYFLTLGEIRELLYTRSPKIISRAMHRQRLFDEMDRYIFPEMIKGLPKPINFDESNVVPADEGFTMTGIPVSRGTAKAYLRVALTIQDALQLKPGEILLTYSTDIAWSPYFPILTGVVTEIGGLISHGAVISREYGIPCISGLHGATQHFQTGDYVLLDGNRGTLKKLQPPQQ